MPSWTRIIFGTKTSLYRNHRKEKKLAREGGGLICGRAIQEFAEDERRKWVGRGRRAEASFGLKKRRQAAALPDGAQRSKRQTGRWLRGTRIQNWGGKTLVLPPPHEKPKATAPA